MKKQIGLAVFASVVLGMAGTIQAGTPHHGYRDNHSGAYYGSHSDYRYGGRHNDRYDRHGHRGHSHFGRGLAIVAGAVVLGSVIHAISQSESRRTEYPYGPPGPVADYWYRVDQDGRCFEVRLNQQGREVWTWVDPSYCR